MNLFFTLALLAIVALAVFFFAKFTRYGAVSLTVAWRSYVNWWAAVFMLFGDFIVNGLSWVAGFWDSFQGQFGSLLSEPSAGKALQVIGAFFFLWRMKGQGFPSFRFPDLPAGDDKPGA